MNTREQFGNYLLLKKLSEDALGETFRAGKLGRDGMESVVLLRVFNGQGIDGEKLWSKVSSRASLQQRLKSPNVGDGVDMGAVRSVPYAAYEYISGKNLGLLLEQAGRKRSPIPTDHALLITERIALGLAAVYENKVQEQRTLHGFLVPQLVMLSNEGETRLLGFEVAPGLRDFASTGAVAQQFARYLPPETLAGAPPSKADDVYSLGAILLELLTGAPLAIAPPEGYGALVDRVELANEGTPIPTELASLLKRSLVPRAERIADVVAWHKALSKMMFEGQYNPTTFNLAFFMHNLFRDDIERETQEIEVEKTIQVPTPVVAPPPSVRPAAAAPPPPSAPRPRTEAPLGTEVRDHSVQVLGYGEESSSSKKGLVIGLAVAAILALAGVGAWLAFGGGGKKAAPAATVAEPAAATAPGVPVAAEPVPAAPTPEEIEAQIGKMVEERMKSMEATVKSEQDKRLQDLQRQLEEAKRVAAERERQPAERAAAPEPLPERARAETFEPLTGSGSSPAGTAAATAPATSGSAGAGTPTTVPAGDPAAAASVPAGTATATDPAALPAVRRGDLVSLGPGVTPPERAQLIKPRYPPMAERMKKHATVRIQVLVDENGRVTQTKLIGADPGFGFADAALDAAKRTPFRAASKTGVPVKMWTELKFAFQP